MAITGIDHVQLAMPEGREAEAIAFYEGLLGLGQVPKPPSLAAAGGCWFEDDGVKVHIGVDPDFHPARKAHPALVVTDLEILVRALVADGVTIKESEPLDGYRRVHIHDPFGNRVELMAPITATSTRPGQP